MCTSSSDRDWLDMSCNFGVGDPSRTFLSAGWNKFVQGGDKMYQGKRGYSRNVMLVFV